MNVAYIYRIRGQVRELIATFQNPCDALRALPCLQYSLGGTLVYEGPKTGLRIPDRCILTDQHIACREVGFLL